MEGKEVVCVKCGKLICEINLERKSIKLTKPLDAYIRYLQQLFQYKRNAQNVKQ